MWQSIFDAQSLTSRENAELSVPAPRFSASPIEATPSPFARLIALPNLCVVELAGTDAGKFLQAQVCNDVAAASDTMAQLNGYCSPKGRLLALFHVVPKIDSFLLIMPNEIAPSFIKRLRMFVLNADVSVEPRVDLLVTGVSRQAALGDTWQAEWSTWPTEPLGITHGTDASLVAVDDTRAYCVATAPVTEAVWMSLSSSPVDGDGQAIGDHRYWRLADIVQGIPSITESNQDAFVPQMVNLEHVGGLSFKKGCYPGQEIVARMQYLGKLKRHMQRYSLPQGSAVPLPGAALQAGDDADAGTCVDAVATDTSVECLAVVKKSIEPNTLTFESQPLTLAPLPYAVDADTA